MWRVLVVDGDAGSRAALVNACSGFASIVQAATAQAAREVLEATPIHLMVVEHRLADAVGLDLLAAVKARRPQLPVIMSTAYGSERVCAAALKLGARDYFIKPWVLPEIVASIRSILGTARRRLEIRENVLPGARVRPGAGGPAAVEQAIRDAAHRIAGQSWSTRSFDELARDLGLSKSALSRKFKQTLRVSYRRFVVDARITQAMGLLGNSHLSITEIAHHVGFGDLPRFDKVFKMRVGVSPSRYRERQRGAAPARSRQAALA